MLFITVALLVVAGLILVVKGLGLQAAGLTAAIVGGGWLIQRPMFLAGTVLAAHCWANLSVNEWLTPFKLGSALLVLVTLGAVHQRRHWEPIPTGYGLALLAMFMLILASEFLASVEVSTQPLLQFTGVLVAFFALSQLLRDEKCYRILAVTQTVNLLLITAFVVREVNWGDMLAGVVRARGPMLQANSLGVTVARLAPFALAMMLERRNSALWRVIGLAALAGSIYCEFAAASRAGTVGFFVTLSLMALLVAERLSTGIASFLLVTAMISGMLVAAPRSFDERVIGTVRDASAGTGRDLTSERLAHIDFARGMIPERPLLGYGTTGFAIERSRHIGGRRTALHSAFISVVVAWGVPAGALYLGIIAGAVVLGLRGARRMRSGRIYGYAVVSGTVGASVAQLSDPDLFSIPTWAMISACYIMHLQGFRAQEAERATEAREAARPVAGPEPVAAPGGPEPTADPDPLAPAAALVQSGPERPLPPDIAALPEALVEVALRIGWQPRTRGLSLPGVTRDS